jgi:hypothetical protein
MYKYLFINNFLNPNEAATRPRVVGESCEAATRIQQHRLFAESPHRLLALVDDFIDGFNIPVFS